VRPEETFVRSVVDALQEHGQAATQFVTAHLDRDVAGVPDIVFSPNEPEGRVVCVEVRQSSVPISASSNTVKPSLRPTQESSTHSPRTRSWSGPRQRRP